jgi:hydrogenase maturation protease
MNSPETEFTVLVIGYGNALRGDDGVGCEVARRLEERALPDGITVVSVHQLLPELAEPISRAARVIFIDADAELPAGEFRSRAVSPSKPANAAIGHHQTPGEILRLAHDLYGYAPPATLWSVGGENFGYQDRLSPIVHRALPGLIQELLHAIGAHCEPLSAH